MLKTLTPVRKMACTNRLQFQLLNILKKINLEKAHHKRLSLSSTVFEDKKGTHESFSETKSSIQPASSKSSTPSPYYVDEKAKEIVEDLKKGNIFYPYKDHMDRFRKILLEDIKVGGRQVIHMATNIQVGNLEIEYFPRCTDILIVGCSPVGLMTAFEIKNRFPHGPNVIVIDRNSNFPSLSTNLGQGTLMQQLFKEEEEIEMSKYGAEFLSSFHRRTEVQGHPQFNIFYEPMGGLLLADESNADKLLLKADILKKHDVHHKLLSQDVLKSKFPWINVDNVLFGMLGLASEGVFDPWSFLVALKCKAVNLGVTFLTGEVIDLGVERSVPVRAICRLPDGTINSIDFCYCVLATGLDTLNFVEIINKTDIAPFNVRLPLEKRKRYEYCMHNPDGPGLDTPIIINTDGTYFRREGLSGHYVAGVPSIPTNDGEENSIYNIFDSKVKPFLMNRLPQFEKIDLINGWEDSYEFNTANEVGIIGPHPMEPRILYASGFNHLGLQLVPAVGRAIMEYMIYDDYRTIDLKSYHIDNLYHKQHLEADRRRKELLESQQRVALNE